MATAWGRKNGLTGGGPHVNDRKEKTIRAKSIIQPRMCAWPNTGPVREAVAYGGRAGRIPGKIQMGI
jgi:hypothetical protein